MRRGGIRKGAEAVSARHVGEMSLTSPQCITERERGGRKREKEDKTRRNIDSETSGKKRKRDIGLFSEGWKVVNKIEEAETDRCNEEGENNREEGEEMLLHTGVNQLKRIKHTQLL